MIDMFLSPPSPRPLPTTPPVSPAKPEPPKGGHPKWVDSASERKWSEAILLLLREHPGMAYRMWDVVNTFVAEGLGATRADVRAHTRECLEDLTTSSSGGKCDGTKESGSSCTRKRQGAVGALAAAQVSVHGNTNSIQLVQADSSPASFLVEYD